MVATAFTPKLAKSISLEDWMGNPPDQTEWVDGELIEKTGMTLKHGRIQGRICFYWRSYMLASGLGGEVYTEAPCLTVGRGRKPDVAYLEPDLLTQFGDVDVLPQSFSLIAEIISPTDRAEEVFAKAKEYLQSGCQEVWLVFPENQGILVMTQHHQVWFGHAEIITTQAILQGFSASVKDLLD